MRNRVVDLGANEREWAFVSGMLRRLGLPANPREAVSALARTIRDHKHFETLLTSCGPEERQDFYDAVSPHLRFTAKPLDVYVALAGQMAEREQLPVMDKEGKLHPFQPAQDVQTAQKMLAAAIAAKILTLKCAKCTKEEQFFQVGDETPVAVRKKALQAGWILVPEEICPDCLTSMRPNA